MNTHTKHTSKGRNMLQRILLALAKKGRTSVQTYTSTYKSCQAHIDTPNYSISERQQQRIPNRIPSFRLPREVSKARREELPLKVNVSQGS